MLNKFFSQMAQGNHSKTQWRNLQTSSHTRETDHGQEETEMEGSRVPLNKIQLKEVTYVPSHNSYLPPQHPHWCPYQDIQELYSIHPYMEIN